MRQHQYISRLLRVSATHSPGVAESTTAALFGDGKYLVLHSARLLLSCLLEAVKFINERETYHGDIYPEFIYLDDRGQRR